MPNHAKSNLNAKFTAKHTPCPTPIKVQRRTPRTDASLPPLGACTSKRMTTSLQVRDGGRDIEAIGAVITDWVVPLLVAEFLAELDASPAKAEVTIGQHAIQPRIRKK